MSGERASADPQRDGASLRRVAIVASRWNQTVTSRLVAGAKSALTSCGVASDRIDFQWVAGSFELGQATGTLAKSGLYDVVIPLGCLIQGETLHYEVLAHTVAESLDAVGRETGVAVSFGVVTASTLDQALARAGGAEGNKGEDAAFAAVDLALLQRKVRHESLTGA